MSSICDVDKKWIFDSGATDTMTNDLNDIKNIKSTRQTHIQTANRVSVKVEKAGSTEVTSNLELKNCLFISSLSYKLLSIGQLTKEMNCCVLMFSGGCYVQEIPTGKIIGHGTEIGKLYYVDEVAQRCAKNTNVA